MKPDDSLKFNYMSPVVAMLVANRNRLFTKFRVGDSQQARRRRLMTQEIK